MTVVCGGSTIWQARDLGIPEHLLVVAAAAKAKDLALMKVAEMLKKVFDDKKASDWATFQPAVRTVLDAAVAQARK